MKNELINLKSNDKNVLGLKAHMVTHIKNPKNLDVLYLVAYHLLRMGEFNAALYYLERYRLLTKHTYSRLAYGKICNFKGLAYRGMQEMGLSNQQFELTAPVEEMSKFNLGMNHLTLNQYTSGFALCETRFDAYKVPNVLKGKPSWDGKVMSKPLYLLQEGGLGDIIQMSRFTHTIADQYCRVYLHVEKRLFKLFKSVITHPDVHVIDDALSRGFKSDDFGAYAHTQSLPYLLKIDQKTSPVVRQDEHYLKGWKPHKRTKPVVGINWGGNPEHETDYTRSIPTALLKDLLDDRFEWVSIHHGAYTNEIDQYGLKKVLQNATNLHDTYVQFLDLDYVVSVDTSTIHLAGSMGIPSTVMLSFWPEWRWGLDEDHCAWYSTVRQAKQEKINEWGDVFNKTLNHLTEHFYGTKKKIKSVHSRRSRLESKT